MHPEQLAKADTEYAHQCAVFCWRNMAQHWGFVAANDMSSYSENLGVPNFDWVPELALLYAVKNSGHGDAIRGARAKAEGVTVGIPDMCLPVKCGDFGGFYIELKRPGKHSISAEQKRIHAMLCEQRYAVFVAVGWREAVAHIQYYLEIPDA